jgi:hypothetical protein
MRWTVTVGLAMVLGGAPARGELVADVSSAQAARGTVQGTVTTRARAPRPIRVTFDQKVCGAELPDQSILVDPSGHLANAVVTLTGVKAASPPRTATVTNEGCAFVPRVQVVGSRATMKTSSKDPVLHTTTVQLADGRQLFNLALPMPGLELSKPLEGAGPLRVGCSTHQWMRGWIVVSDDVAVVTGPDGRFTLPDVPPGTYELRVWHEALRAAPRTVTVAAGQAATVDIEMK